MDTSGRASDAYKAYTESGLRFDFFLTAATGVALGFALREFTPSRGPVAVFLLPVAWLSLLISLGAGLGHLAQGRKCLKEAYEEFDTLTDLDLAASAVEHSVPLRIRSTGDSISGAALDRHKLALASNVVRHEAKGRHSTRVMTLLGGLRNIGLLVGASSLSLWRLINLV